MEKWRVKDFSPTLSTQQKFFLSSEARIWGRDQNVYFFMIYMLMTIYLKKYSYKIIGMYEKYAELRWKELS